jgi:hypothetical protein
VDAVSRSIKGQAAKAVVQHIALDQDRLPSKQPVSSKDRSQMAIKKIFRDVPADDLFVGF